MPESLRTTCTVELVDRAGTVHAVVEKILHIAPKAPPAAPAARDNPTNP